MSDKRKEDEIYFCQAKGCQEIIPAPQMCCTDVDPPLCDNHYELYKTGLSYQDIVEGNHTHEVKNYKAKFGIDSSKEASNTVKNVKIPPLDEKVVSINTIERESK